jgi:hypothetical protein
MVVVGRALMSVAGLEHRQEPVPVQESQVGTRISRGVPPQEMVVMNADLSRAVVMANVVKISLRQGHVNHAQHHDPGQQDSRSSSVIDEPCRHVGSSVIFQRRRLAGGRSWPGRGAPVWPSESRPQPPFIMRQRDEPVKLAARETAETALRVAKPPSWRGGRGEKLWGSRRSNRPLHNKSCVILENHPSDFAATPPSPHN